MEHPLATHFKELASYNHWANAHVYAAAASLKEEERSRNVGLFFGSVMGTLNHLLLTDRIWLWRLTGDQHEPGPLDRTLHTGFEELAEARLVEDRRLQVFVVEAAKSLDRQVSYRTVAGDELTQTVSAILTHVFNHQTHHRGQAHSGPPSLSARRTGSSLSFGPAPPCIAPFQVLEGYRCMAALQREVSSASGRSSSSVSNGLGLGRMPAADRFLSLE